MQIPTPVTKLLGIDVPIVQAGMSWASSCAELPLAVSRAGGLGTIGAGPMRLPDLESAIAKVRDGTDRPFAVNVPLYRKGVNDVLDLLEKERVPILIASQGGPQRYLQRFRDLGTICIHVVASEEHAVKAADAGVDALVVVGAEAGGHPPPSMVSTLISVRAVAQATPETPLIASGGFADGRGLAAGLALGAGAVQFGSRFAATIEANLHPAYKQALLSAAVQDTLTVGRGLGVIRAIRNAYTEHMVELESSGAKIDVRRAAFAQGSLKAAALDGEVAHGRVEAGQAAGLVGSLLPAAEVVNRLARDYLDTVDDLPRAQR